MKTMTGKQGKVECTDITLTESMLRKWKSTVLLVGTLYGYNFCLSAVIEFYRFLSFITALKQFAATSASKCFVKYIDSVNKGPSIYDVHTEGDEGGRAQVDACGRGQGGPAPCGRPHRKLKLESTDVVLSSSHAKKLASFLPEFRLWTEKKWKFFRDIN